MQILKFFEVYSTWEWPKPVTLIDYTETEQQSAKGVLPGVAAAASAAVHSSNPTVNGILASLQQQQQQQQLSSFQSQSQSWNPDRNPQERHHVRELYLHTVQ